MTEGSGTVVECAECGYRTRRFGPGNPRCPHCVSTSPLSSFTRIEGVNAEAAMLLVDAGFETTQDLREAGQAEFRAAGLPMELAAVVDAEVGDPEDRSLASLPDSAGEFIGGDGELELPPVLRPVGDEAGDG